MRGYCDACTEKVQGGAICAACDALCVTSAQYGAKLETAGRRALSMADELPAIAAYPFRDLLGFVLLALFGWVFGYLNGYLAHGVLVLYAFHALTRVSNGDFASFLPDSADLTQIMRPAWLAFAALVISTGPLMLVTLLVPGADLRDVRGGPAARPSAEAGDVVQHDDEEDLADEPDSQARLREQDPDGPSLTGGLLLAATFLWMLAYTPIALTVAALSHSYLSTLNPVIGIDTIRRMGATYWHAMAIYSVLAGVQWALGYGLDRIPIAGALVRSFVDAYAWLAIACTLGMAVFKKAEALGWD
jgi:hypothetical protein